MIRKLFFSILFFVFCAYTYAQVAEKPPVKLYLEVGGSMNAYKGDLSPSYQKWSSAFHIGLVSSKNRWLNPTASISIGNLTGQQTDYNYLAPPSKANTFFKTNFAQLSLGARLNAIKSDYLTVYVQPNISIMRFTPRDIRNQKLADQAETRALGETLPSTAVAFPISIGAMYCFKASDIGIGAEVGLLNPLTKYLDNIGDYGNGSTDNSLQIKLSVYVPLTRIDLEAEEKQKEEKKLRREEWLRKRGILNTKTEGSKAQPTQKTKVEDKKLTPAQRKRQKTKEKAEREKNKKAAKKAKALEKKQREKAKKKK
jgi:hypothetical protein